MDPATLLASDKAVQDAADILAAYEKDSKGLLAQTQLADKELWCVITHTHARVCLLCAHLASLTLSASPAYTTQVCSPAA